jgi:serine/threonine-protein kinase
MSSTSIEDRLEELLQRWDERQRRGEDVPAEGLCADCPELAAELRRRIDAVKELEPVLNIESTRLLRTPEDRVTGDATAGRGIPDLLSAVAVYRPQRYHAHGGLGEVLTAHQEDLDRTVALKRIRPEKLHDAARRRFVREAAITARLQHPGIVPIYGLGQDRDGPFYTMPFIEGRTLQEAIDGFHGDESLRRDPGRRALEFRGLLQRFIAVCNTMAYAHDGGVIHRDLKPSNIMLGPYGETLVLDWGLAKRVGTDDASGEVEGDAPSPGPWPDALTATGAVLGTPQYMSPEQAKGQPAGPASDVFNLGLVLYAILTGKPAFDATSLRGADPLQAMREATILPPRSLEPRLPRALDAVCLKALAARLEDRYGSAKELGEEVGRWLADEPVAAYREPWPARLARWARRNRTLVTTTMGMMILLIPGLATSLFLIARERDVAREQRRIALDKSREADVQRLRAEQRARQARKAVDTMYTQVAVRWFFEQPAKAEIERDFLVQALKFYQELASEQKDDPEVRWALARAYFYVAKIEVALSGPDEAVANYHRAIDIASTLAAEEPNRAEFQRTLAACYINMGVIFAENGRTQEAEDVFRRVVAIGQSLVDAEPGQALDRHYLIIGSVDLGGALETEGRSPEAQEVYRRAIRVTESMLAASPRSADLREKLAYVLYNLGVAMLNEHHTEEAVRTFRRAARIFDELRAEHIASSKRKTRHGLEDVGNVHYGLGRALEAAGDLSEAKDEFTNALAFWNESVADFAGPAETIPRIGLARTQFALADLTESGRSEALREAALSMIKDLMVRSPKCPALDGVLAQALNSRAGGPAARGKLHAVFAHVDYDGTSISNDTQPNHQSPEHPERR